MPRKNSLRAALAQTETALAQTQEYNKIIERQLNSANETKRQLESQIHGLQADCGRAWAMVQDLLVILKGLSKGERW